MENEEIQNELAALKADVAEIKQLVRELHNVFIKRSSTTPNEKEKSEIEELEQSTIRKLKLLKVYHKKA
jgi:archaellum component FlaC